MRSVSGLLVFVCAGWMCARAGEAPETARVQADIDRLRALVEAGAAPPAQLEAAGRDMDDAADAAFLRRTLYGQDLTEDQLDTMMEAATRRLDRRRQDLEAARALVAEGAASQLSLGPYLEELDRSRREYDLAASRAVLCRQLTAMAKAEEEAALEMQAALRPMDRFRTEGAAFTLMDFRWVQAAFETRFGKPMPVSALGDTAVHRSMGFDHRDRVDVAIHPDQPEGVWLRQYLEMQRIPYFAFRHAVKGKSTGAHIHIGPPSTRLMRSSAGTPAAHDRQ